MSKQSSGLIIGQKGVQYGLQKVVPKKPGLAGAQLAQRKAAPNVFGDDDSDEEDVERQIARQADKKRAAAKVQQVYEEALAQDPSVFDYDSVYDSIQEARVATKQADKVQRQSKYIASLLEQAQQRKREQDVLYERRMVREREQEDHLYEDKERFVTSAYRRKLEEDKKWHEAERLRELEEQRNDVRKVGHMGNFYANLLTKNVAFGAASDKPTPDDQPPAQPSRHSPAPNQEDEEEQAAARAGRRAAASASPPPADTDMGGAAEGDAAAAGAAAGTAARSAGGSPGPSAKTLAQLDRYDLLRLEAERALRQRRAQGQQKQPQEDAGGAHAEDRDDAARSRRPGTLGAGGIEDGEEEEAAVAAGAVRSVDPAVGRPEGGVVENMGRLQAGRGEGAGGQSVAQVEGRDGCVETAAPAEAGAGGKRRNDEGSVQSARERYLARKQQKSR